nr:MAG TPA: hypothetical protein [Caudoviricetes sp.]
MSSLLTLLAYVSLSFLFNPIQTEPSRLRM